MVSPNERFARAYSSLPTLMPVHSSSRTTVASTFSRRQTGTGEVLLDPGPDGREHPAELDHPAELGLVPDLSPLAGGSGTASARARPGRWPGCARWAIGQIQTSVYAGGIAEERIRAISFLSVMRLPSAPT